MPLDGLEFHPEAPPLRVDEGGVVRIGTTRISLDLIVEEYESGVTPEAMVHSYDTLDLADVYTVVGWYLRRKNEVTAWLGERARQANALRNQIESERPRVTRQELLARRAARETNVAPAGQ